MAEENAKAESQNEQAPSTADSEASSAGAVTLGGEATATAETKTRQAPAVPQGQHYFWGTGRRKSAVARVRIRPGEGRILINKRDVEDYFRHEDDRNAVHAPLVAAGMAKSWDIWANVTGGGRTGQSHAITMGIARAMVEATPDLLHELRTKGYLTRDARMKERKKPGQPGARRRFQFSKR